MAVKPVEQCKEPAVRDVLSALSLFQSTITQVRPAVELVQLPEDSLPVVEEIESENDCPACD